MQETSRLPSPVYVPVPPVAADSVELPIELVALPDGRDVLQVYSSKEVLLAACGAEQDWVAVHAADLPEIAGYADFDAVLLDATQPRTTDGLAAVQRLVREDGEDWLYLPCADQPPGSTEIELELPEMDGQVTLLVYTSRPLLLACCGPHQPWTALPADQLDQLCERITVDRVAANIPLPDRLRRRDDDERRIDG